MKQIVLLLIIVLAIPLFSNEKSISVVGYSSIKVEPNRVLIRSGIESSHKDIKKAITENSDTIKRVIKGLSKFGIGSNKIETGNYNIYQQQSYNSIGSGGDEYRVSHSLIIIIDDLNRVDEILGELIELGVNRINSIDFIATNLEDYRKELLIGALNDARDKATILASKEAMVIKQVKTISEGTPSNPPAPMARMLSSEADSIPVIPGNDLVEASYYVEYLIEAK